MASLGGVIGGMVTGYSSQILGRRLAIMIACGFGGALLYPYIFTRGDGIHAAAFFIQFCVQGAWYVQPFERSFLSRQFLGVETLCRPFKLFTEGFL